MGGGSTAINSDRGQPIRLAVFDDSRFGLLQLQIQLKLNPVGWCQTEQFLPLHWPRRLKTATDEETSIETKAICCCFACRSEFLLKAVAMGYT